MINPERAAMWAAMTPLQQRAYLKQLARPQQDNLGARPSSSDDSGLAYCGRPRAASKRHADMVDGAYGKRAKSDGRAEGPARLATPRGIDKYSTWRG